jgi:hypothetical protein
VNQSINEEGIVAQAKQRLRGTMEPSRLKQEVDEYKAKALLQILVDAL